MFKFGTIGAFKQVRNNPRCKAEVELRDGMVVIPDDATGIAAVPDADGAKGKVWIVGNIVDKPEICNRKDFVVEPGEYVRAFYLEDVKELPIAISADVVSTDYASIADGDKLVPEANTGKWVKTADASEYAIVLEVLEKTTFGDQGLYCKVLA